MSAAHTPGPWALQEDARHPWRVICPNRGYEAEFPEISGLICEVGYAPNARLIAAAPTMLDALREAERILDYFANDRRAFVGSGTPKSALAMVQAALALATGEQG